MNRTTLPLSVIVLLVTAAWLYAGPLNPPAGPITSTGKTLTEVEPRIAITLTNTPGDNNSVFKISQPGSYYLTGNVTGVVGKHGIEITASGVTLDLNGFDLVGVASMGAFDGVSTTSGSLSNITVRNGSVRNWGDDGVDLGFLSSSSCIIEGVRSSGNTDDGITGGGSNTITGCTAFNNTGSGITAGTGSVITGCTARTNGASGISCSTGCKITSCNSFENTGTGIFGSAGSSVINCVSHNNGGIGIEVGFGCTIADCSVAYNAGHGFEASNATTITDCTAISSGGSGFFAYNSVIIRNCNSVDNTLSGIDTSTNCTVENCIASSNTLDGINCSSHCVIRNNNCRSNGSGAEVGAGIHATGSDARIEGNYCSANDYGIDADGSENVIIRNICGNNTTHNFNFVANNIYGTIVDRTGPATAVVAGSAAAGTMGSTDPNANIAN